MKAVVTAISTMPSSHAFTALIAHQKQAFAGLDVVFATRSADAYPHQMQLAPLSEACPLVTSLFDGSRLLFHHSSADSAVVADVAVSLDKEVCLDMHRYVSGKPLQRPAAIHQLLALLWDRQPTPTRCAYDVLPYLVKAYADIFRQQRQQPIAALYALKLVEQLGPAVLNYFPLVRVSATSKRTARTAACDAFAGVLVSSTFHAMQIEQLSSYAILLKALLLHWSDENAAVKLSEVAKFSAEVLGRYPKRDLYFAWKLMAGDGKAHAFYAPAVERTPAALPNLKALSWKLALFRWAEVMSLRRNTAASGAQHVFVPLVAATDQTIQDMVAACPLKAIVVDHATQMVESVFRDEYQFQRCLQDQLTRRDIDLAALAEGLRRQAPALSTKRVNMAIRVLESDVRRLMRLPA